MSDLVERLQSHMGLADMQEVLADCRLAASRISQQDAELERVRRELAEARESRDLQVSIAANEEARARAAEAAFAEARAGAFREAAEIADREGFVWITKALRAKAEETRT